MSGDGKTMSFSKDIMSISLCAILLASGALNAGRDDDTPWVAVLQPLKKGATKAEINARLVEAASLKNYQAVLEALDAGADIINARDGILDRTALHGAVYEGDAKIVALLIDRGADIEATDKDGCTPLHVAVGVHNRNVAATIKMLLSAGANVNSRDANGRTPLNLAIQRDYFHKDLLTVVKALLTKREGVTTSDGLAVLKTEADVNIIDNKGFSPLHKAAEHGLDEVAKVLIEHGADLELKTPVNQHTALRIAVDKKHKAVLDVLIRGGGDITARSSSGWTPLDSAAFRQREMIEPLLKAGAYRGWRYWLWNEIMPFVDDHYPSICISAVAVVVLPYINDFYKKYKSRQIAQPDPIPASPIFFDLLDRQRRMQGQ